MRKIKILEEIIKTSLCTSKYVFDNQENVSLGTYNEKDAIFFDNVFVGFVQNRMYDNDQGLIQLKQILDEYMEFDSDELLLQGDLVQIFGGAIRDAIGGNKINDIDVLCTSASRKKLHEFLISMGYTQLPEIHKHTLKSLYSDIHVISEPITYINSNKKIIQLIFPVYADDGYEKSFNDLIANVDISCCGLSYNGINVFEYVEDAYINAIEKTFRICKDHKMYSEKRCIARIQKFTDRGYVNITSISQIRKHRIDNIIDDSSDRNILTIKVIKKWHSNETFLGW